MTDIIKIIIAVVASAVVFGIVGFLLGQMHRKRVAEAEIGSATQEATRIVNNALAEAETKKKEAIIEAKDEIHKQRNELERELRERRSEVQRQERRIIQKEETLDRKIENLEKKDETLNKKLKDAQTRLDEVESIKRSQFEMLERISGFTQEQAKEYLLKTWRTISPMRRPSKSWNSNRKPKMRRIRSQGRLLPLPFSAVQPTMRRKRLFPLFRCRTMR